MQKTRGKTTLTGTFIVILSPAVIGIVVNFSQL